MQFIETTVFTKLICELLSEKEYWGLQTALAGNPKAGDLIPGGRGLRKIRWRSGKKGKGKSGGIRVIYYCFSTERLYMIYAYKKSKQGDLTKQQLKVLSTYVAKGVL